MSRLTKRHGKHAVQIGAETRRHDEAWLKLAHYEDLEEQIGETVWCLVENYDYTWEVTGYLFMGVCGDYIIVSSEYMGYEFEEQLEAMCEDMVEDCSLDIYIFHKSRVFKTKAEAEAKLAEKE